jgi:hypothetical protein
MRDVHEVDDLRSCAGVSYLPTRALPPGASSPHGPGVPFGSPAYAAADARDITPTSVQSPATPIPGWLATGSLWTDERFVVRVPKAWNGRLIVAGTPAQRSEFACDRLFADPLLARGYAYASGNKGQGDGAVLLEAGVTISVEGAVLPRFLLPDGRGISFVQHAPGHTMERWLDEFLAVTEAAHAIAGDVSGRAPLLTYAVGLSNGGYEVRRAIEESDRFDGALTWNAVLWTPQHNLLRQLPQAIAAMEAGRPDLLEGFGLPPDVAAASGAGSLYAKNLAAYWYVTVWLHAMHLDPQASLAYGDVGDPERAEEWNGRIGAWRFDRSPVVERRVAAFANTGDIRCKFVDLASQFDHLIAPSVHFDAYERLVEAAGRSDRYRRHMLANAQHVDAWSDDPDYPAMQSAHARVMAAFDELVRWVEG